MRKKVLSLFASATGIPGLCVSTFFCVFFMVGCSSPANHVKAETTSQSSAVTDSLEGAWELVWEKSDDKIITDGTVTQFKMFHDGFFSLIMQDSGGKWNTALAGTYETNGSTYKESVRFSNVPEFVGATDWQEFELKGDTLYFYPFTKVVLANGEDVTARWPKSVEKRVRAKK